MAETLSVAVPEIVADDVRDIDGVSVIEGDRTLEVAVDVVASVRQSSGMVSVDLAPESIAEFTETLVSALKYRLFTENENAEPRIDTFELSVITLRAAERVTRDYQFTRSAENGVAPGETDELADLLRTAAEQI
ncbi:hypothetical protein F4561_001312 [Lipingzhangella halophila]|uniref:Uncharacterized protein n=1 Tax=Lipingzhangella halophila TaxID=1783352 RepID=A0A7W7W116_9ACTN|nr:hypothetical protein [Lipingzhangella halophila]MBB4930492.1 hypothetical protein [Lipingzhangella halophila]